MYKKCFGPDIRSYRYVPPAYLVSDQVETSEGRDYKYLIRVSMSNTHQGSTVKTRD